VDDIRYACEELLNLRTQETVCVRDDSNSEHCASVLGARPYVLGSSSRLRLVITRSQGLTTTWPIMMKTKSGTS
jgi:hypothetical protein